MRVSHRQTAASPQRTVSSAVLGLGVRGNVLLRAGTGTDIHLHNVVDSHRRELQYWYRYNTYMHAVHPGLPMKIGDNPSHQRSLYTALGQAGDTDTCR